VEGSRTTGLQPDVRQDFHLWKNVCVKHQQDEERPGARPGPITTRAKALAEQKTQEQKQQRGDGGLEERQQAGPKQQQQAERL